MLTLHYDKDADILYVDTIAPYASQESGELDEGVVIRTNPATGAVETMEILFFSRRVGDGTLGRPIAADLQLARPA